MNPATAATDSVKHVTSLVESAKQVSEGRLALILAMLVILAVIVIAVEGARIAGWVRDFYKSRKVPPEESPSELTKILNGPVATELIRSRVDDIHLNTTACGTAQRETLSILREHRQDMYKAIERVGEHIEANTEAVQTNTQVLRGLVDHIKMRPCQLDRDEIARRLGLTTSKS